MGYKDPEKQRAFQAAWMRSRRREWLEQNGPCKKCGSTQALTVVKNDPSVITVKVWSWSDAGRNEVLKKCIVLCRKCAVAKYAELISKEYKGTGKTSTPTKLSPELVWMIRGRLLGRESSRAIARAFGVGHEIILQIQHGKSWTWLKGGRRKVHGIRKVDEHAS